MLTKKPSASAAAGAAYPAGKERTGRRGAGTMLRPGGGGAAGGSGGRCECGAAVAIGFRWLLPEAGRGGEGPPPPSELIPLLSAGRAGDGGRPLQSSPGAGAGVSRAGAGTGPPSPLALPPLRASNASHTVSPGAGKGSGWRCGVVVAVVGGDPRGAAACPVPRGARGRLCKLGAEERVVCGAVTCKQPVTALRSGSPSLRPRFAQLYVSLSVTNQILCTGTEELFWQMPFWG